MSGRAVAGLCPGQIRVWRLAVAMGVPGRNGALSAPRGSSALIINNPRVPMGLCGYLLHTVAHPYMLKATPLPTPPAGTTIGHERRGRVRRRGRGPGEAVGAAPPGGRQRALPRQASSTRLRRAVRSSLPSTPLSPWPGWPDRAGIAGRLPFGGPGAVPGDAAAPQSRWRRSHRAPALPLASAHA